MPNDAFTLRFHDARLRNCVREIASREGIPQNDLVEGAVRHEVILRGELLADDLQTALLSIRAMTAEQRANWIQEGADAWAEGEANQDPLRARQIPPFDMDAVLEDPHGVLAAFAVPRD